MERLVPMQAAEPLVRGGGGMSALRVTVYGTLAILLLTGAWLRFNDRISAILPSLAAPDSVLADQAANGAVRRALVELSLLPDSAAQAAIAEMGLPRGEAASLSQALKDGRLRLVRLPLVDDTPAAADGTVQTHAVEVASGGYTNVVQIGRIPVTVTLPVGPAGGITLRTASQDRVGIVTAGLAGPLPLPPIRAGQAIELGVVAE
jgi:hypothetical protein